MIEKLDNYHSFLLIKKITDMYVEVPFLLVSNGKSGPGERSFIGLHKLSDSCHAFDQKNVPLQKWAWHLLLDFHTFYHLKRLCKFLPS